MSEEQDAAPPKVEYPKWIYKRIINDWGKRAVIEQRLVQDEAEHNAAGDGWEE